MYAAGGEGETVSEPFWHPVRVQFDDTDAQGRVFYANYFPLADQARCAFWLGIGMSEAEMLQIERDTVIVHLEADYLGPAEFYDRLRVYVWVESLGRSSLCLGYRIVNERSEQEIFRARLVMVQVELASGRSRPWSDALRQAIIRHHGPQVVDA